MHLFHLLAERIKSDFYKGKDFIHDALHYYKNPLFRKVDLSLLSNYFFKNPYKISKEFLKERGEVNIYAYGETPLLTLEKIVKRASLGKEDVVFELGCGRGRTCFWLNLFIGCKVIGIDYIKEFIERADKVKEKYQLKNLQFTLENFLESDFSQATCIYLHGSCMSEEEVDALNTHLLKFPKCKRVISVSFPLDEKVWQIKDIMQERMSWGEALIYLQEKVVP